MAEVIAQIVDLYDKFISVLPEYVGVFFNFLILVLLIVIYSIFVWKFYKFIAKKDFIGLNLNKYNKSEHPFITKILAGGFYLLEYIIILPFLIFFWFAIFTGLLILLTKNIEISQILIISATIIAAIRITSYYKEGLSEDIAKFLPLTLLAIAVLNPNSFVESQYLESTLTQFSLLPSSFGQILYYLGFIVILEVILRFFDFIFSLFGLEEVKEIKEKIKEEE